MVRDALRQAAIAFCRATPNLSAVQSHVPLCRPFVAVQCHAKAGTEVNTQSEIIAIFTTDFSFIPIFPLYQ
jgi:hypothetical protein